MIVTTTGLLISSTLVIWVHDVAAASVVSVAKFVKKDIFLDTAPADTLADVASLSLCVMTCQVRESANPSTGDGCNAVEYDDATKDCKVHHVLWGNIDHDGYFGLGPRTEVMLNFDAIVPPDAGYTKISGRYYKYFAVATTWDDARAACVADGGDLPAFASQEDKDAVDSLWQGNWHWIGMKHLRHDLGDVSQEAISTMAGEIDWLDGTPLTSAAWVSDGSIIVTFNQATEVMYKVGPGYFGDARATDTMEYICQL